MNQFFERAIVPASDRTQLTRPDEQVSWRLSDERLGRRERAKRAAQSRTGDRRDS